MPSDILEPRGVTTQDIRITPEKQFGFMKTNSIPEGGGGDRCSYVSTSESGAALNGRTTTTSDTHWESSLFSSSLSELFSRKLRLPRSDKVAFMPENREEEEPCESLEEMEAQTIGNLLPDEDDFFAEVTGEAGCKCRANVGDDLDDCDLFSNVGGMELDGDVFSSVSQRDGKRGSNVSVVGEHPRQVLSRILFVRNIDGVIDDYELRVLFEQYGDVRALHTSGKNHGFIVVSYYDIRAAQNAVKALYGRLLRGRKLDIHYSTPKENPAKENASEGVLVNNLDSSISNEELHRIFTSYGEIREVRRTMHENSQIYIEFFDVRAADAAIRGLNGCEIAGRQIKLTPQFAADDGRHFPGILPSTSINGGSMRAMHNSVRSPVNSFIEHHQSINLPPSTRVISASKPVGLQEPRNLFENSKTGIQSMPNLHPHSFPDYLDNFASGSPYKSSTTFSEMVSSGQKAANEGFMTSNVRGVDGLYGSVVGSPINQGSHPANLSLWSNSNNTQQHSPLSGMMWSNSPSRGNGIPSQRVPPVTTFSRASPLMVMASSSPVHHHVGSAPVLNSPFWDRRQVYAAESPETSGFHLGSSMGFHGSSPSHPMEIGSHKVFSHGGGNRMDATNSKTALLRSSRRMPHLFPGRNQMLSMPGSFDLPNERYRNLSHRRSDSSSSNAEKKLYELDVDRILRGEDSRTTLMIKNIPNKYTSKMLLAAIDEYCKGTYDFLYLPIDFKNKCNVGYAFINLTEPENIVPFYKAFNGKKWEKFNSEKVASLAYGRIQGKSALIAHFQNSSLMNEDKRCRPILFHTAGPNAGDQEPFPMGSNIRSRPGKHRTSSIENYNNLSIRSREESPNGTDSI